MYASIHAPWLRISLKAVLSAGLLAGCLSSNDGGHEDSKPARSGKLLLQDGSPAVNARVRVYSVNHVPDSSMSTPSFATRTDSKGSYTIDVLPKGEYNILGELEGRVSYLDSVFLDTNSGSVPTDTLDSPGSLTGLVGLQPNHDPRTVTLQVLGTSRYVNVDAEGRFKLENLAGGNYSLRLLSTNPDYTPLYVPARIRAGTGDTLRDSLLLPYTGIPVVVGLKAAYDTLTGTARISWNAVSYSHLDEYLVYRSEDSALSPSDTPIGKTRDTAFLDPVFDMAMNSARMGKGDTNDYVMKYRIKARNLSNQLGLSFRSITLNAVSPAKVRTFFSLNAIDARDGEASILDTVRIILDFKNLTRLNRQILWRHSGSNDVIAEKTVEAFSGLDTLFYATPPQPVNRVIRVEVVDDAGSRWKDSLQLSIIADPPVAHAGEDTTATIKDTIRLKGRADEKFPGRIEWAWDIGNTGHFRKTSGSDTLITLPSLPDSNFHCILRVVDESGNLDVDTVRIRVFPSRMLPTPPYGPLSAGSPRLAVVDSSLYSVGGTWLRDVATFRFNTSGIGWISLNAPAVRRSDGVVTVSGGKVYAIGGHPWDAAILAPTVEEYDPALDTWSPKAPVHSRLKDHGAASLDGRIYVFGGDTTQWGRDKMDLLQIFDSEKNLWTNSRALPTLMRGMGVVVLGGKIYLVGGQAEDGLSNKLYRYDPLDGSWTALAPLGLARYGLTAIEAQGKIVVLGGTTQVGSKPPEPVRITEIYDPMTDSWKEGFPCQSEYITDAKYLGDRVYILGYKVESDLDTWSSTPTFEEYFPFP